MGPMLTNVFWQLGRHDHLGSLALHLYHLAKLRLFDFLIHFSLTVFRRFHQKWRETILKNSEIF